MNGLVKKGTAGGSAGLAAPREVHPRDHGIGDHRRIRIWKRDQRVLSAELEQHRLDAVGRGPQHCAARGNAADERDLGYAWMSHQRRARLMSAPRSPR